MMRRPSQRMQHPFLKGLIHGDQDQDPNHTDIWYSFETDEDCSPFSLTSLDIAAENRILPGSLQEFHTLPEVLEPIETYRPKEFNPKENITQAHNGTIALNCLEKVKQNFSKGEKEIATDAKQIVYKNYKRHDDGTIEMVNQESLRRQKQVLGSLVKQFGSALFSGKSIMSISLPVTIFESRSQLEREAYNLLYAPQFLEKASTTSNLIEQFKQTIAFFIASLPIGSNPQKPFNPILGETFQGIIGGCPVYAEQISHHPPICALQMLGKNFTFEATTEFTASISFNSVRSGKIGLMKVTHKNTKTKIWGQYPFGLMSGTAIGKRTYQFVGKFSIFDLENKLFAEIDMDLSNNSTYKKIFNTPKVYKDLFYGGIYRVNNKFAEKLRESTTKMQEPDFKFKEKDHAVEKLDVIEGSWLEYLKIGEKTYWTFGEPLPNKLKYWDRPLPSDSNYRLDVLYMRTEDEEKAQEYKNKLEELQRADRKLRNQHANKNKM